MNPAKSVSDVPSVLVFGAVQLRRAEPVATTGDTVNDKLFAADVLLLVSVATTLTVTVAGADPPFVK